MIQMNARLVAVGTTALVVLIFLAVVVAPGHTNPEHGRPSEIHRGRTPLEERGRVIYISMGCQYCHSQYIRRLDWGPQAERIARAGDYVGETAPQLGSNRNGPDLSQQGGQHTDDWHVAHFYNPRWTRPESIMPRFSYLAERELRPLIAYVQSLGGTMGDHRVARQWRWREQAMAAYAKGADANVRWLHSHVPPGWLRVPSPYPVTDASFTRSQLIYQRHCLGCHGPVGDGQGPAAAFVYPPPFNFTTLRRHGIAGGATGGMLYYQIMNGVTGTAMPMFKQELESEKIWDVGNFVAGQFVGILDTNTSPRGIDAAYEPEERLTRPPVTEVK